MNVVITNDLPDTEDQAGIKFECSSIWLWPLTKQCPATVKAEASAVKMRWDSWKNKQICKEERLWFSLKSQGIKLMLGAQKVVTSSSKGETLQHLVRFQAIWRGRQAWGYVALLLNHSLKCIKSAQFTGSMEQQVDIWLTGNRGPCHSVMLPWQDMRVCSVHPEEKAVPWFKRPWSCEHDELLRHWNLELHFAHPPNNFLPNFSVLLFWFCYTEKESSSELLLVNKKGFTFSSKMCFQETIIIKSLTYHILIKTLSFSL